MKNDHLTIKIYNNSNHELDSMFDTLEDKNIEITALVVGTNLKGVWKFSNYSKQDFASIIGLDEIDDIFNGRKLPTLEILVRTSKIFSLPVDFFFRPNYFGLKAFWKNDLIKHLLIQRATPLKQISQTISDSKFYSHIFIDYAEKLIELQEIISTGRFNGIDIGLDLLGKLSRQYYKLLEVPSNTKRRGYTKLEQILSSWFFVSPEYIARLIVEGIRQIRISENSKIEIVYSFIEDIQIGEVFELQYDPQNYKMITE